MKKSAKVDTQNSEEMAQVEKEKERRDDDEVKSETARLLRFFLVVWLFVNEQSYKRLMSVSQFLALLHE